MRREHIQEDDVRVDWRPSRTYRCSFRCGSVYIHINHDDWSQPFRLLMNKGHTGNCQQCLLEAIGRLVTLQLQESDIPTERLHKTLMGINCGEGMVGHLSCMDDLAWAIIDDFERTKKERVVYVLQEQPDAPITMENGVQVQPLATLKSAHGGVAHIIEDDHCYVLVLMREFDLRGSPEQKAKPEYRGFAVKHWFPEAVEALKKLPTPKYA